MQTFNKKSIPSTVPWPEWNFRRQRGFARSDPSTGLKRDASRIPRTPVERVTEAVVCSIRFKRRTNAERRNVQFTAERNPREQHVDTIRRFRSSCLAHPSRKDPQWTRESDSVKKSKQTGLIFPFCGHVLVKLEVDAGTGFVSLIYRQVISFCVTHTRRPVRIRVRIPRSTLNSFSFFRRDPWRSRFFQRVLTFERCRLRQGASFCNFIKRAHGTRILSNPRDDERTRKIYCRLEV